MELRRRRIAAARLAALAAAAFLALAPAARADELKQPASPTKPPPGYSRTAQKAIRIADLTAEVRSERAKRGRMTAAAYTTGTRRWQVSYFQGRRERAQVLIEDRDGSVVEAWTGPQVAWKMARGYEGAFGRKVNAPYVWLPLCLLFLVPFFDPRRPFRMLHLDLLVLLGFGVSHYFFNRGEISTSVPLVYPVLLYLLARMLWVGFRPRERRERLVPLVPATALALALVFLIGFRVGLNVIDSRVIDVGYAGVVGADRIADGDGIYGEFPKDIAHGDTYGPVNYVLYAPFEQALPWRDGSLDAAHGAAIAFDLLTILGLLVLGRRLRPGREGRLLGFALGYAWAAYPYSLFVMNSNANDTLVAMFVVWALVALASPAARGALTALGAAAKFAPAALAPLLARGRGERPLRSALVFSGVFALVLAAALLPFLPDGGVREVWDRTVGYQAGRDSPFSIWGQEPSLEWLKLTVQGAAIGLALLVGFVPRRRSTAQIAALGAAVLIALQLGATHWFYLYVVWFAPLVLVALFALQSPAAAASEPAVEVEERRELEPVPA